MASGTGKKKRTSSALPANDNDMDDTTSDTPTWDTSDKHCRQFVRDLKHNDWLYSQVPSARTLIERGYLRYKGGKAIMPTYDMIRQYKDGTLPTYSFENPSPVTTVGTGPPAAAPPTPAPSTGTPAPASAPGAGTAPAPTTHAQPPAASSSAPLTRTCSRVMRTLAWTLTGRSVALSASASRTRSTRWSSPDGAGTVAVISCDTCTSKPRNARVRPPMQSRRRCVSYRTQASSSHP